MLYWILPESGIPISVSTVQRLTNDERSTDEVQKRMSNFEDKTKVVFEAQAADITNSLHDIPSSKIIDHENEDQEFFDEFTRMIDDATLAHADDVLRDSSQWVEVGSDQYIGHMELALPQGNYGEMIHGCVTKRMRDKEGLPIGRASDNPLLDSRKYEVEYADGNVEELTANIIANLIAQVDNEGHRQMMLEEVIDHQTTQEAIP